MGECPCHYCVPPERHQACHDTCDKYILWVQNNSRKSNSPEEQVRKEYNQYTTDVIARVERNKRKHK